jgi:D-alanine-D-alanine ligase
MELTCGVIGNEDVFVLPPSNSVAVDGILSIEEKFLPGAGENQTPAPLAPEALKLVQDEVKRAYIAAGCRGYSRVDCFYQSNGKVVILEVNTLPALTPATCLFHQALEVGIKPMELIDKIVELGCECQSARVAHEECERSL